MFTRTATFTNLQHASYWTQRDHGRVSEGYLRHLQGNGDRSTPSDRRLADRDRRQRYESRPGRSLQQGDSTPSNSMQRSPYIHAIDETSLRQELQTNEVEDTEETEMQVLAARWSSRAHELIYRLVQHNADSNYACSNGRCCRAVGDHGGEPQDNVQPLFDKRIGHWVEKDSENEGSGGE
ncbi:hypothetical protein CONLIGDRAFT_673928 [Coniochaeta ligniaria NRRL 30616]|uniref:Uncharacterized protein n=1 Tax=Coniochaeta ligniaria NRRL 30616 TaxID=1408157 RepID=A0A1J7IT52_9PEZI|nr:hypothetical protein CONLIGDRAFT_673928 [Coniochaeta ligniaria NRRL 30616]